MSPRDLDERVVQPLYRLLLHANFLDLQPAELASFSRTFRSAVETVTDDDLERLLRLPWRDALTGAWLSGALLARKLRPAINEALLASRTCYAGQGYCFALARFGDASAAETLVTYLREYLPVGSREYDQRWVAAALAWLDRRHGTDRLAPFLDDGLWTVTAGGRPIGSMDPRSMIERFPSIMSAVTRILGDEQELRNDDGRDMSSRPSSGCG